VKKTQIKYLNARELGLFFDEVKKDGNARNRLLFSMIFHYGLRVGEVIEIRLKDIHPKLIELKVRREKSGIDKTYPISAADVKILKRYLKLRDKHPYAKQNPYLFITSHSTVDGIKKITCQKLFSKYSKLAKLDKTNIHSLRHSCAVDLLMRGEGVFTTKTWLGHSSVQSTMCYLALADPEWQKKSAGVVEGFTI
jgi:integrase/recombinase XerC